MHAGAFEYPIQTYDASELVHCSMMRGTAKQVWLGEVTVSPRMIGFEVRLILKGPGIDFRRGSLDSYAVKDAKERLESTRCP